MIGFEELLRTQILGFVLEASRVLGLIIVAPLAWSRAPARVTAGLVIVVALAAHGITPPAAHIEHSLLAMALGVISELVLGFAMGFLVRLIVASVEIMGDAISPTMGFGMAQIFDPGSGSSGSVLATLLKYLAILLMVTAGVHRELLAALIASFHHLPPGTLLSPAGAGPTLLELSARAIDAGVRMALPIIGALIMIQVSLAFVSRAAPAMQIFSIGFTVTLMSGMALVAFTMPDVAREILAQTSRLDRYVEQLLFDLGARPR